MAKKTKTVKPKPVQLTEDEKEKLLIIAEHKINKIFQRVEAQLKGFEELVPYFLVVGPFKSEVDGPMVEIKWASNVRYDRQVDHLEGVIDVIGSDVGEPDDDDDAIEHVRH